MSFLGGGIGDIPLFVELCEVCTVMTAVLY
jgi:hypothetical protein